MNTTPEPFRNGMWLLSNIAVPLALGTAAGVCLRPLVRRVMLVGVIALAVVAVMVGFGLSTLDTSQLAQLRTLLPEPEHVYALAHDAVHRSPAAVLGLAIGLMLQWWRRQSQTAV